MDDRWNTKAVPHTELFCCVWLAEAAPASTGPSGAHNCSVAVGRGAWCDAMRFDAMQMQFNSVPCKCSAVQCG